MRNAKFIKTAWTKFQSVWGYRKPNDKLVIKFRGFQIVIKVLLKEFLTQINKQRVDNF